MIRHGIACVLATGNDDQICSGHALLSGLDAAIDCTECDRLRARLIQICHRSDDVRF